MYLIHEFHNLSWITEINELLHDILIYWDAPVYVKKQKTLADPKLCNTSAYSYSTMVAFQ